MSEFKLPPIGVMPKKLYYEQVKATRYVQLMAAIDRYIKAGLDVDQEWIKEFRELEIELTPSNQEDKQ